LLVPLTPEQLATIRHRFIPEPERPGLLVAQHVLATGHGSCLADRWPEPRVLLAESGGNFTVAGDPDVLHPRDLIGRLIGFIEAPASFVPLLLTAFPEAQEWQRMIFTIEGPRLSNSSPPHGDARIRRLGPGDAEALVGLGPESGWITKTWAGPIGLATSGMGWGAFAGGQLVAVSCPFFVGERYEDLGVVTEPSFRGRGLSTSCAAAVCQDVRRRGRTPIWTTSPDNTASLAVAAKLGATLHRRDRLFVVGVPIPEPARPPTQ
jgi:RimJ/RimL family protein N-acetyltransferase